MISISLQLQPRTFIFFVVFSLSFNLAAKAEPVNRRSESNAGENIDLRDKVLLNLYSEKIFDVLYERKKEKISADETNERIATYCFHIFLLYSENSPLQEINKDLVKKYLTLIKKSSLDAIDLKHAAFSDPLNCLGDLGDVNAKIRDVVSGGSLYPELFLSKDKAGYIELVERFKTWMALR